MSSTEALKHYKHDVSGKFKDIATALSSMEGDVFNDDGFNEVFHAVHEVLIKMVMSSRRTIQENLKQDICLVVTDHLNLDDLPRLVIGESEVRFELTGNRVTYYYKRNGPEENVSERIAAISAFLPVKSVVLELKEPCSI